MAKDKLPLRKIFVRATAGVLAIGVIGGVAYPLYKQVDQTPMRITVTDTHTRLLGKGEGFGVHKTVYETDKGSFSNTTNWLAGKFSRGDIEKQIQVGKTYDVTVTGVDLPFFNSYRNIISAREVPPGPG